MFNERESSMLESGQNTGSVRIFRLCYLMLPYLFRFIQSNLVSLVNVQWFADTRFPLSRVVPQVLASSSAELLETLVAKEECQHIKLKYDTYIAYIIMHIYIYTYMATPIQIQIHTFDMICKCMFFFPLHAAEQSQTQERTSREWRNLALLLLLLLLVSDVNLLLTWRCWC